ncbi:MAG: radical SAM protein [Acidobacteria bacterium]|jgi:uncharacterized protein|nr:radical SAM protein [Acidobacteriota bacterium]
MFIDTLSSTYSIIKELGLLVNSEISGEYDFFKSVLGEKEKQQIIESLSHDIADEEIKEIISDISSLVLGLTQKCNLRCTYCIFSGIYKNQRTHSSTTLSTERANKAVDLFFKLIQLPYRKTVYRDLSIGFYGGESLLELPLVESIVHYVSMESRRLGLNKKFIITFSISTNGILLDDIIVDFLVKNDVSIAVSIDGPESEHNKFRVTPDHKGSWKVVMDNLYRLKKRYPEFYDRKVTFLCTIHPRHDKKAIDKFFSSHRDLFELSRITFSNFRLDDLIDDSILNDTSKNIDKPSNSKLHLEQIGTRFFAPEKFRVNRLTPKVKLTGTCFPAARKIFIDSSGYIHLCEAIPGTLPIGNVSKGLNFEYIKKIVREFNKEIIKQRCWDCEVWFLCNACFLTSLRGKKFKIKCPKDLILESLKLYLQKQEKRHEETLFKIPLNSVLDYLEFLQ